jgi:hypothetical protein
MTYEKVSELFKEAIVSLHSPRASHEGIHPG